MTNTNQGAEALLSRILADAEQEGEKLMAEANAEAEKIKLSSEKNCQALIDEAEKKAEIIRADTLEKSRTNAALAARKNTLKAKRELLDRAFELAYSRMINTTGEKRNALIERLIKTEAEGGETVIPSKADLDAVKAAAESVNKELLAKGKQALTVAEPDDGIEAGFILKAKAYEKNCSFSALLTRVRAEEESNAAKILFN